MRKANCPPLPTPPPNRPPRPAPILLDHDRQNHLHPPRTHHPKNRRPRHPRNPLPRRGPPTLAQPGLKTPARRQPLHGKIFFAPSGLRLFFFPFPGLRPGLISPRPCGAFLPYGTLHSSSAKRIRSDGGPISKIPNPKFLTP